MLYFVFLLFVNLLNCLLIRGERERNRYFFSFKFFKFFSNFRSLFYLFPQSPPPPPPAPANSACAILLAAALGTTGEAPAGAGGAPSATVAQG